MTMSEIAALAGELVGHTVDASCVTAAATEIAVEYRPLVTRETTVSNGTVYFTALSKPPVTVYAVTLQGKRLPFRAFYDRIETEGKGTVTVEYAYRPTFALRDECPFDARTVAYGAAAEYCLKNSLFEEAATWDAKFRDSLTRQAAQGGYVRTRRWL